MSFSDKLSSLVAKHKELGDKPSGGALGGKDFAAVSKEYSALSPIVEKVLEYQKAEASFKELEVMSADASDKEMQAMAIEEFHEVKKRLPELEHEIKIALLPKDEADEKNAILEIRAGTGGDEAALFAVVAFVLLVAVRSSILLRPQWPEAARSSSTATRATMSEEWSSAHAP